MRDYHNARAGIGKRSLALLLGLGFLAGCLGGEQRYVGEATTLPNLTGGIAADEPRAALVGRNILAAGGNAADAAVAAYFAMAVTYPAAAGLGGGGICLAHKAEDEPETVIIDFLPRGTQAGNIAFPGNVRGMAALNARFGKLPLAQLIGPAEALASGGTAISKALAREIAQSGDRLLADPGLAAIFAGPDGALLKEGDRLVQVELGAILGQIRARGILEFYSGRTGQALVESANAVGLTLDIATLRDFKVQIYAPLETPFEQISLYTSRPPASGGLLVQQAMALLDGADNGPEGQIALSRRLMAARAAYLRPGGDIAGDPEALIGEGGIGAGADPAALPEENGSAASLVAIDAEGGAVACAFTMNAPFGLAQSLPGTGLTLAPAPDTAGAGFSALAPMAIASKYNGELYFVAASGGGVPGAFAQALIADAVMRRDQPLDAAMQAPRAFASGDSVRRESEDPQSALGRVNAAYCFSGTPSDPETCTLRNDYRGAGLASVVGED